ncbi:MAG TPA: hypothetical protein VLB86_07595 [Gaiellaceae bacterium]|nr:hypothetical protein [Gaiellaceae bacterium]
MREPDDNHRSRLAADVRVGSLECVECGRVETAAAAGWKAYVADGHEFPASEVLVYCPGCAEREFGDPG